MAYIRSRRRPAGGPPTGAGTMVLTVPTVPGPTEVRRWRICSEPSFADAVVVIRNVSGRPVVVAREDFCGEDVEALVSLVLEALGISEAVFGAFEQSVSCERPGDLNRIEASTEF